MAMQTSGITNGGTSVPASNTDRIQTLYSRKMLPYTMEELVLAQFAQKGLDLEANRGTYTIRFFKRRPAKTTDVQTLTEGTAISTFTEVDIGYVDVVLAQYGEAAKIADVLMDIDIFNILDQNIAAIGEDAALHAEGITRNALASGMLNSNGRHERFAGVTPTLNSANDFGTFNGLAAANAKISRARALACVTQLRRTKVPKLDGGYVAVVCPEIMHDIRQDDDWLTAAKNSNPTALYKREAIQLDGVRYVETTVPFIEAGVYGTYSATGTNYSSWFMGRGAFGCPKLSTYKDPWSPKIVINSKADKSDPLNQFAVVGWKSFWGAKLLKTSQAADVPYLVQLRTKTTFE